MFRSFAVALSAILAAGPMAATAVASPISAPSLVSIRQADEGADPEYQFIDWRTDGSFSYDGTSGDGSSYAAYGHLATGKMGTRYRSRGTGAGSRGSSQVTLFDAVTFSTPDGLPREITYSLALDGTIASTGPDSTSSAGALAWAYFYDITGLDTWLNYDGAGTNDVITISALIVSGLNIHTEVGGELAMEWAVNQFYADLAVVDTAGTPIGINFLKEETLVVDPSKTYGLAINTGSFVSGTGMSDLLGTGRFVFSELNGATFESASGVLLSAQVPEPATGGLLAVGLGVFWLGRRHGRGRPAAGAPT